MSACVVCGDDIGDVEPHTFHEGGCPSRYDVDTHDCTCDVIEDCHEECCPTCEEDE